MASRAPAITPDVRSTMRKKGTRTNNKSSAAAADSSKKVVSFGLFTSKNNAMSHSNTSKTATTTTKDEFHITKEEAIRQYKLYRSSPTSFPSYDCIQLVKLPNEYLPSSLTSSSSNNNGDIPNNGYYWPALIYNNLVEVVRDLSPNESPLLKAQLIVEYKKCPTRKVARLLGWNGIDSNDEQMKREIVLFAESRLELLRLSSSDSGNSNALDETINFCESLMDMDKMYHQLLLRATKEKSSEKKKAVKQFAIRFGYALDMAFNCMAMDIVGSEPLVPRIYQEEDDQEAEEMEHKGDGAKTTNVCKTPNAGMVDSDANDGVPTIGNSRPSPAEDSMFSTAAVADGADFDNNIFSGQHKSSKASSSIGIKRKKKDEINSGNDDAKAVTKKAAKPTTSTAVVVARGASKPPKSSTNINKTTVEGKKVVAPATTKSVIDNEVEEDTPKEIVHWKDVWATMKRCGWTWKGGSGLMTDYYYIKPKCKVQGGVSGIDYFVSVGETMEFARRTYGYDPNGMSSLTREQLFSRIAVHAKFAGEVVPPLTAEETLDPNGPWRDAWEVMLRSGWTWKTGSGLMMDYYYIKPGCKVAGGVEGQDYFVRVEDVQQFATRNYGWRGNSVGLVGCAEDCGATRAQTRRTSSSDNGGTSDEVPVEKRQRLEATKPVAKEGVVEAVAKSTKPAKPKIEYRDSTKEDDDDMDEDEEETHSTFSQSGLQSKKLFSDECADEFIPPLAEDILGDEAWSEAWKKMRDSGWKWTNGTGLMMDYFYIKPGCKVKGGVVGKDYFVLVEDVQRFAMRNYGWKGGDTTDVGKRKAVENKPSMQQKRQHDAVEEPSSSPRQTASPPTKKAATPLPPLPNPYEKKAQWQELQRNGWKAISAGRYNKLHDWYYVRPNCDLGDGKSKLGVDFFLCKEDAIEAVKKSGNISSETPKQHQEEDVEVEGEGEQQQVVDEAPTSPIRSVRKGTPAPPFSTPQGCRTKPQDPAIPLLSSPESCSPSSRYDMYEWHNLWPALERAGWRCIKAGKYNPLHNYYYVRPNRDPGDENCVLGQHYFDSQDDVISFVKNEDEGKKNASRKSMGVMLGAFEEVADS